MMRTRNRQLAFWEIWPSGTGLLAYLDLLCKKKKKTRFVPEGELCQKANGTGQICQKVQKATYGRRPVQEGHPPPPSRQSCHGWYASYWNAVLFILDIWSICSIRCVSINIFCKIHLLQSNHSSLKNEGINISGQEIIRKFTKWQENV